MANKLTQKVVLKNVRASYPHLFTPDSMSGKYNCDFILPKSDPQVKALKAAAQAVLADCQRANPGKAVAPFNLRDGDIDKPAEQAFANSWFFKASTSSPALRNNVFRKTADGRNLVAIQDESEFYGGCMCQASMVLSWYEYNNKYGVHALLNGVCLEEGGEPFGKNGCDKSDFIDEEEEEFD